MSDNEDYNREKRELESESQAEQPAAKRQRVVNLQAFVPNNRDLISELTQLGQNLSLVADASRVPETEISDNFVAIQQQINDTLQEAFEQAQLVRKQNEEQRIASEMSQMGEQERDQFQLLQQQFIQRLQPLTKKMAEQLTYGEQAQMFNIILTSIDTRLNENNFNNSEPNIAVLLIELATITYNFALEQLSVSISNIYGATPDIIRQLTSLITASGMVYNYLPDNIRTNLVVIPYLGPLFGIMNRINPVARSITDSAAVVTTIYYLLRNAGIDTTNSIALLGESARELATSCALEAGRYVCSGAGLAAQAATSIMDGIADRLGNILTSEYQDFSFQVESQESQESASSMRSLSSQRTVNTLQSQNSARSTAIAETVNQLLNTPETNGGININVEQMNGQIVQERIQAIMNNNEAIIPEEEHSLELEIITQPSSVNLNMPLSLETTDSGMSGLSDESTGSEEHWSYWLFGPSNFGGKRLRKSRRHLSKKKRTRKARKARKGKKSVKKGKKSKKTLKRRYRIKM
jgi:hypothetical protein